MSLLMQTPRIHMIAQWDFVFILMINVHAASDELGWI
jgi:hypothetical protein